MKAIAVFTFAMFWGLSSVFAQQTTYSQEDSTITTSELKRFYRYITRANVEEKTLFKLGFWPNAGDRDFTGRPSFRIGLNADVSVERKITPSFSVMAGFDFMLRYNKYDQFAVPYYNNGTYIDTDRMFRGFVYAKVGTRFYYDMAKRIREGKAANNFSGNYIGIQYTRALSVRVIEHRYDTKTGSSAGTNNYDIGGGVWRTTAFSHVGISTPDRATGFCRSQCWTRNHYSKTGEKPCLRAGSCTRGLL
ncbi:hypothetical protein [Larkinella humicola]|uniref:Uncharacterized protein n=1 Tax=Larkinella humicola TaxID=2607654 RepID=A0A5N1J7J2_9BACT|nr:hypothetical protein [Larkinella humicola]KAA9346775.1 hypothetical protein F0P93_27630 [Larkinella humicola]